MSDSRTLNADAIAHFVSQEGVAAYVEQTGGGVATIYAGPTRQEPDYGKRFHTVVGPGEYGWGNAPSVMSLWELFIGPDDFGQVEGMDAWEMGCRNERDVADLILVHVRYRREKEGEIAPGALARYGFTAGTARVRLHMYDFEKCVTLCGILSPDTADCAPLDDDSRVTCLQCRDLLDAAYAAQV
jgi:hypothetical protein